MSYQQEIVGGYFMACLVYMHIYCIFGM